ncbi:xylulokinase, partial [Streptomyces anulatus]|nr:xylulokinase [Streptomyces anulatus]
RPLVVPGSGELVALGAAALAASAAGGGDPVALATAWQRSATDRQVSPVERDMETWERVTSVLERASGPLLTGP